MTDLSLRRVLYPFATGALGGPGRDARVLILNAPPRLDLPDDFPVTPVLSQRFRPDALALEASGRPVSVSIEGDPFDLTLVLAGRHRGQNENWVADALARTKPGGRIVVAGAKDDGIGSLRRRVEAVLPLEGEAAKFHGVAFWLVRPPEPLAEAAISALMADNGGAIVDGRFHTRPGMFSHDRVDPGSRLLAEALPRDIKGAAADFCAGWGYLAAQAIERCPAISALDLYEADFAALEAARRNLDGQRPEIAKRFLWHDLAGEAVTERYDAIVMNPPFHTGRAAEPELGRAIIRRAAGALKRGGRLFLVANRTLPYEAVLTDCLPGWGEIGGSGAFKVLAGRKT